MGKEIERKYVVNKALWQAADAGTHFKQGYLNSQKERVVRVRQFAHREGEGQLVAPPQLLRPQLQAGRAVRQRRPAGGQQVAVGLLRAGDEVDRHRRPQPLRVPARPAHDARSGAITSGTVTAQKWLTGEWPRSSPTW